MSLPIRSQSALEYMMTYGWAILVIVIVAGVLYSLGIFSPSSSLAATITGFSSLSVTGGCIQGGALYLVVTPGVGYPINITKINVTSSTNVQTSTNMSVLISPGQSQTIFVPNSCTSSQNSQYSDSVSIIYSEPGEIFPGPYTSTGKISGSSGVYSPQIAPFFNGTVHSTIYINSTSPELTGPMTVVAWVKWLGGAGGGSSGVITYGDFCGKGFAILLNSLGQDACDSDNYGSSIVPQVGSWYFLAFQINGMSAGSTETWYLNSTSVSRSLINSYSLPQPTYVFIGDDSVGTPDEYFDFNGYIVDVQLYGTVLSSSEINTLYKEGLGAGPLSGQNLVAWWPLDGNTNDYSGNSNNAVKQASVSWKNIDS